MISKLVKSNSVRYTYILFNKFHSFFVDRLLSSFKFRALIQKSGDKSYCHFSVEIKYGNNITVGSNTRIGSGCTLGALGCIVIGSNVVVSKEVLIETAGLDFKSKTIPYSHKGKIIIIENNVWIGARAIILGGVTIGENSIIGAGAVISKDVLPNSIIVGQYPRLLKIKD